MSLLDGQAKQLTDLSPSDIQDSGCLSRAKVQCSIELFVVLGKRQNKEQVYYLGSEIVI